MTIEFCECQGSELLSKWTKEQTITLSSQPSGLLEVMGPHLIRLFSAIPRFNRLIRARITTLQPDMMCVIKPSKVSVSWFPLIVWQIVMQPLPVRQTNTVRCMGWFFSDAISNYQDCMIDLFCVDMDISFGFITTHSRYSAGKALLSPDIWSPLVCPSPFLNYDSLPRETP